jgi:hypothetical protein
LFSRRQQPYPRGDDRERVTQSAPRGRSAVHIETAGQRAIIFGTPDAGRPIDAATACSESLAKGAGPKLRSAPSSARRPRYAAADTGVVEEQVDFVGLVAVGNLVAKPLDLRPVGDIGDVRREPQPLRQSRRLAQPLRFRQADRRDVAHCDIAGFRHQLAGQLAAHSCELLVKRSRRAGR